MLLTGRRSFYLTYVSIFDKILLVAMRIETQSRHSNVMYICFLQTSAIPHLFPLADPNSVLLREGTTRMERRLYLPHRGDTQQHSSESVWHRLITCNINSGAAMFYYITTD